MNLKTTKTFAAVAATAMTMTVSAASADSVNIAVDRVQQRYPWNNIVDVDYTISGIPEGANPLDYRVEMVVRALVNGVTTEIPVSNYVNHAWCDLPSANGKWRVSWDSVRDGANIICTDTSFEMRIYYAPVAESEAEFMIVDLSGGKDAAKYPVRYVRSCGMPTSQFNKHLYKTDKLVLRRIKAGTFVATGGDIGSHSVQLTHDFFLGIFELTQGQYVNVVGSNPSSPYNVDHDGELAAENPVGHAGRTQALGTSGFATKISAKAYAGSVLVSRFSLPTAAQWEYACRAGTTDSYFWSPFSDYGKYVWAQENSGKRPHTVGMMLPNAWGLYDMAGNIEEFVYDYSGSLKNDPTYVEGGTMVNPMGPPSTDGKGVTVGRCCEQQSSQMSSDARGSMSLSFPTATQGIRISCTVE